MAPREAPASLPYLYVEGNSNKVYWALPVAQSWSSTTSGSDSDLGSFKSIKSSTSPFQRASLPVVGNTHSLILSDTPKYPHHRGLLRSKSDSAIDRPRSSNNQLAPISHLEQSTSNSPTPPLSPIFEHSAYSLKTVPEELEGRTRNTKTYDSTSALCEPDWDSFQPAIDKPLLESHYPLNLEGYDQAQSFPNSSKLLASTRSDPKPPTLNEHRPVPSSRSYARTNSQILHKPSTGFPSANLTSGSRSNSFETAPTSPEVSSDSFETALMSPKASNTDLDPVVIKSTSDPLTPAKESIANTGSGNFRELQLPQTPNGNADTHHPQRSPNTIAANSSLFRPQAEKYILDDDEAYISNSSFPQRPGSPFSPPEHFSAQEPAPVRRGLARDGLLTAAMHDAVNDATALYDSINLRTPSPSEVLSNSLLIEALAHRYALVVDAKNALMLRQSAILVDIGLCLESLVPMINLHATDEVKLKTIRQELKNIRQACDYHQIKLEFGDLEWHRSAKDSWGLAFVDDKRYQDFSWKKSTMAIDECSDIRASGAQFLNDPAALIENRLPKLRSRG